MGSSQYLYNAKMREEIAEQLGVTPTPGGLEILLRQSENNRMAHGGIVHLADGGEPKFSALKEFGQILKGIAPGAIAGGMTGGLFPFMKWGAGQIANKFGGQGTRDRFLEQMKDAGASDQLFSSATQDLQDEIEGMSTHEFQEAIEGYKIGDALPAQDMSANRSTAQALMAMPTYSAMYNVGGSGGHGKGAGGNFGQGQRMIRKEQKKIKQRANKYDQFGDESWYLSEGYPPEQANYYANTFKNMYGSGQNLIDTMHDRGFGQGAYEAFDRVAESPPESAADSKGRPQNWSEIFAHYQETGSFEDSPEAQWGGG